MAGQEAMAEPVVAATVLQYMQEFMQEALASADEDADKAQALLKFMAEAGGVVHVMETSSAGLWLFDAKVL